MARGWESKSVEEQINERENNLQSPNSKEDRTPREREQHARRESIHLARAHTINAMESTRDERYRALLKRTLDYLDSELTRLGVGT